MPINSSNAFNEETIVQAIAKALEDFYESLIDKIDHIDIKKIMRRKNPYLYRAKAMQNASEKWEVKNEPIR